MDSVSTGRRIKAARQLNRLTVPQLAARLNLPGLGEKTLGKIERNERDLRTHEVAPLAQALDVPAGFLTGEDSAGPSEPDDPLEAIHQRLAAIEATLGRVERAVNPESLLPGVRDLLEALEEDRHATSPQTAPTAK